MTVGQVDGYVAGLAVSPEAIPPSEWMPAVWSGDGAPVFRVTREAAARAVGEHHDRVVRSLFPLAAEYTPIFELDEAADEALWGPWIKGFVRAMGLRSASWEGVRRSGDGEVAASVAMIEAMHDIGLGRSTLGEASIAEMERIAPGLIPSLVEALKPWSAPRRFGNCAEAGADGAYGPKVIPFPGMGAGRSCNAGLALRPIARRIGHGAGGRCGGRRRCRAPARMCL